MLAPITHQTVSRHLASAAKLGSELQLEARVLDFGCGIGDAVADLVDRGFDAFGVDIVEYWGAAIGQYWEERTAPTAAIAERLHRAASAPYRLPFPNGHFEFCFSDQVFEHIADPVPVFREISRVLKPGAISLHRFPAPFNLLEGHIGVPVPYLCRSPLYLAAWALAGRRMPAQRGMSWRQVLRDNRAFMARGAHYPSKRWWRMRGEEADVSIDFIERPEFADLELGGLAALRRRAEDIGIGPIARVVLPTFAQRYMVLRSRVRS